MLEISAADAGVRLRIEITAATSHRPLRPGKFTPMSAPFPYLLITSRVEPKSWNLTPGIGASEGQSREFGNDFVIYFRNSHVA